MPLRLPSFIKDVITADVSDRADQITNLFCAKAAEEIVDPKFRVQELNYILDELEKLQDEFDNGLDARKAIGQGLQTCWNNLPEHRYVVSAVKPRIMHSAIMVGAALQKS